MPRQSRNTKQKELIREEIEKLERFFTAEELYTIIKRHHPKIGLATIYRLLKKMKKAKALYSYTCGNKLVYSKGRKSHCHFECEKTGKVIHFTIDNIDFLKDRIPGTITSFQLEVKGVCRECGRE